MRHWEYQVAAVSEVKRTAVTQDFVLREQRDGLAVALVNCMSLLPQIQDSAARGARRIVEVAVMLAAAIFEVGGDAMIRAGLRGYGWLLCGLGVATLGAYGVGVNLLAIDFSKLLATYVAFFAIVSIIFGRVLPKPKVFGFADAEMEN